MADEEPETPGCCAPARAAPDGLDRPGNTRALRGGSYLCHASYRHRYRVSARMANTPESSTGNIGFRRAAENRSNGAYRSEGVE